MARNQTPEPTEALSLRIPIAIAEAIKQRLDRAAVPLTKRELILGILTGKLDPLSLEEKGGSDA